MKRAGVKSFLREWRQNIGRGEGAARVQYRPPPRWISREFRDRRRCLQYVVVWRADYQDFTERKGVELRG